MKKVFLTVFIVFISFIYFNASVYPADFEMVLGDAAGSNAFSIKDSSGTNEVAYIDSRGRIMFKGSLRTYCTDFLCADSNYLQYPWYGSAVSGGYTYITTGDANHPGVTRLNSAAAAGSGYRYTTNVASFLIAGGEHSEFVFKVGTTANTTVRLGFQDSITSIDPTDGVWINISTAALTGRAKSGGSETTTVSSYTITASTWYRGQIVVNQDASQVWFSLYDCISGSSVWSGSVASNIPTAGGNETGHGVVAVSSGTVAIVYLDCMNIEIEMN